MHPRIPLRPILAIAIAGFAMGGCSDLAPDRATSPTSASADISPAAIEDRALDDVLRGYLARHRFTGDVGGTVERRLGRRIDRQLADVGRLLWFDPIQGLNDDNACGGCHSPTNGFGDTQSIAIGVDNNRVVGPARRGPRNQRRTPMV